MSAYERRPAGAPSETLGGSEADSTFDAVTAPLPEFLAFLAGYRTGLHQGAEGESARRDELDAAVYRRAVRIVHLMAELPTHDELEERRRRRSTPEASR